MIYCNDGQNLKETGKSCIASQGILHIGDVVNTSKKQHCPKQMFVQKAASQELRFEANHLHCESSGDG